MIRVHYLPDGGAEIETVLERQPAIYLDHDSLGEIARNTDHRRRFLEIWTRRGELLFSWANALDISGPQEGSAEAIKEFLEALGPHWLPLELNPWKVANKEAGLEPSGGTPSISESFLGGYFLRLRDEATNLGRVVDLVQGDREEWQQDLATLQEHAFQMVHHFRDQYRKHPRDPGWLDQILPPLPNDPARPAAYLLRELERLVTRQLSYQFPLHDGTDFMHASVSAPVADFLLLDRAWKRRVLAVAPPKAYQWLFYRAEIDEFLNAFEKIQVARRIEQVQ